MIEGFSLENNFHRSIFNGKSLKIESNVLDKAILYDDPKQKYIDNTYGFRGKDFSNSDNFVAAGCSFTYGVGVPEDAVWWKRVAKGLNLSTSAAIARPGASTSWIVEKLFSYFAEFGNPKYLLCFFPDLDRFSVPIDGVVLEGDPSATNAEGEPGTFGSSPGQRFYATRSLNRSDILKTKYLKRPYNIRSVYTTEMATYGAVRSIRFLEQYCKAAGITLLWTTWDLSFMKYLEEVNKVDELKFKNYFDLNILSYKKMLPSGCKELFFRDNINNPDSTYYDCLTKHFNKDCSCSLASSSCHQNLVALYGEDNFYLGTDNAKHNGEHAHPGTHLQAHYADRFIEELVLRYPHEFK